MEQLLLVTSCDSPAGIGASLWTDIRTNGQKDGQTWRLVWYGIFILARLVLLFYKNSKEYVLRTLGAKGMLSDALLK